ncbi:MAG TPA: permease [Desulfitobacterium dehalogenans]|uniref:Permease n=1 Tax=Desulfitobacterium dehalogenans TaxID=36854 RepID=A0A7C7D8T3_9FIRM|nr:permease [Desulfitobacterium dehalogenans]
MLNDQIKIALAEFWHVGWVLVLLIAGISVLTGFVREYIPQEKFQKKLKNQGTVKGAIMGAGLGVLTPFCSASMVPVAMGMIEMSASFSTVLPFLLSAPLANFVVVGIIFGTFGFKVALIYFLWTFSCAIVAGLTVGRSRVRHHVKNLAEIAEERKNKKNSKESSCCAPAPSGCTPITSGCDNTSAIGFNQPTEGCGESIAETSACCAPTPSSGGHKEKVRGAFQFAFVLFRQIIPYVILGAAISGITVAFIPSSIVEKYVGNGAWYAIPLAAAIGVPLYLRIEMAIPLLSALLVKGMSMGAAMALLIGGTGASLPEIAILSSMLKPKGLVAFVLTVFVIATLGGVLFMFI